MNILLLTPWYPSELNSQSGVFIKSQAKALTTRHRVTVIYSTVDYSSFAFSSHKIVETSEQGIREFRITVKKSFPIFNQLHYLVVIIYQSWKISKEARIDIIHGHVGYPTASWAWALSKLLKCPYVITEHTRPQNNFRSFIHQQLTIFGLKRATAVMAVSKLLATEVMKWSNRQVEVMPNIVETERFSVQPYPTQSIQIGFLGALNKPVKGLEVLLNAVAKLNTEFVLHIGGAGLLLNSYKSQATELGITAKCKFYGAIEPTVVPDFMASLHFFVCSSYSETFCVALAEALASGRPVVSTQCGGPEEFVNDTNGILVAVNDEETLANGINPKIRKYHTYDQLLLREQIEMRFSAESFLNRIEKIYSQVRLVKKITVIQK